jgi:DNA-binding NtrC family response regulator
LTNNGTIAVVDDELSIRIAIGEYLRENGYVAQEYKCLQEASAGFDDSPPDMAIVDMFLPDGNALDLLPRLRAGGLDIPIIILTGHGSIDLAVRAMKEGAENFVTKPVQLEVIRNLVQRSLAGQRNRRKAAAKSLESARGAKDPFLGSSLAIRRLRSEVERIVEANSPILIQGETGSGKGVLAAWLHRRGPRAEEAFVDLNCAGLSRELLETELFGHDKGAFTGAVANKSGLLEIAHRGTVFLDEIGDMDATIQPKLLKVVEEKKFRRLGSVRDQRVDVHLIAATHRDLQAAVQQGMFRADLFYRINTIPLRIPSLRERKEDIPIIAETFLAQLQHDMNRRLEFSLEALEAIKNYRWPGNIRELRNVLERAALLCTDGVVLRQHLSFEPATNPGPSGRVVAGTLRELEQHHILNALQEESGSVNRAAVRLGIPRSTLYSKIREYSINYRPLPN